MTIPNYDPTVGLNPCVGVILMSEDLDFVLVIDNVQDVFGVRIPRHFLFSVRIEFLPCLSASNISLTVKNRRVYCAFGNTIGDLFWNMFSSSSCTILNLPIRIN